MRERGKAPEDIDAIFTLALGNPTLDAMELGAIREALGNCDQLPPVVALAHRTGNTMAAHAGLLTGAAALCLKHQKLPESSIVLGEARPDQAIQTVLICSPSLGGQAAALLLES